MPSIDGGSQTSIDYSPHMYVLREGGDSHLEEDYIFVGNATATYDEKEEMPGIARIEGNLDDRAYREYVSKIGDLPSRTLYYPRYHIGVSATDGLVGDVQTRELKAKEIDGIDHLYDSYVQDTHKGIPALEIPEAAKQKLVKVGLSEIAMISGHTILVGLGIELPTDLELLDFRKVFNGTPAEQAAEQAKQERWQIVADELRHTLGFE